MNLAQLHGTLWDAICEHDTEVALSIKEGVMSSLAQLGDDVTNLDWTFDLPGALAKAA